MEFYVLQLMNDEYLDEYLVICERVGLMQYDYGIMGMRSNRLLMLKIEQTK